MEARSLSSDVARTVALEPTELASWVNQIDGYSVTFRYFRTPTSLPGG